MPIYQRPTSDSARLALLQMATATAATDNTAGVVYLAAETQAGLTEHLLSFRTANEAVTAARAAFGQAQQTTDAAFQDLADHTQRLWSEVRNRVRFGDDGPALLTYAQLPQRGRAATPCSRAEWLEISERLRLGADQAVEAGHAPLAQIDRLSTLIHAAQTNLQRLLAAKTALGEARQRRNRLRRAVDSLGTRLTEDLRYALRDLPPANQRQIMRTYGVRFQPSPGPTTGPDRGAPNSRAALAETEGAVVGWQLQPEPVAVAQ